MERITLQTIENIMFSSISFKLSDDVIKIIDNLEKQVGCPSYIKTPIFKKKNTDNQWGSIRNFRVTQIVENNSCMDDITNKLRSQLNKLTNETFDKTSSHIIDIIKPTDNDNVIRRHLCKLIFETSSQNGFYSEVYARLCKVLIEEFDTMKHLIDKEYENFKDIYNNINYVKSEEDYDLFCKNNKINESRISIGKFFVHLMNLDIIDINIIMDLVEQLQNIIYNNQNDNEQKKINDIYVENIFNIIQVGYKRLKYHTSWESFYKRMVVLSNIDRKLHNGISNKCIFTYLDILDYLQGKL